MKMRVVIVGVAVLGMLMMMPAMAQGAVAKGAPNAEKIGWRLGMQAWSFNKFTFFEAVDKTASLGLKYIEAFPGQKLSLEHPELTFDENMSEEAMKMAKAKLDSAGVKLVNYGVVGLSAKEDECRKVFEFAKKMGIETIVSEPAAPAFGLLDKLTEEYKINVALHNHPKPSLYWNYENVLKNCAGHSKRIGSCSDTGHWMRSGINPVEALKKLEGHIVSFHFKDVNEASKDAHDVPWGTGASDAKAMLAEIYRQGVKGVFSIEYEYNWESSLPDIAKCVEFFDKTAAELSK